MKFISPLQQSRISHSLELPRNLAQGFQSVSLEKGKVIAPESNQEEIKKYFPHTYGMPVLQFTNSETKTLELKPLNIGVVLSGGQAPGGHNVITGIFDGIKNIHSESQLFGFLKGPSGLENGEYEILDNTKIDAFRNTGGFDIIGSGRTKLETEEQFQKCIAITQKLKIDAIVIIGGDDSNTNAAVLAEYYKSQGQNTLIVGVPKTIDGDLKNQHIPISFGFDTATKVYSELVGNIAKDACSAKKYWHFIKLMGRSASHIALEVGLQTQANVTLISEEIAEQQHSLDDVVNQICESVICRANKGKNYGIVLIPEGLIEFIPSIKTLIAELNDKLAAHVAEIETLMDAKLRAEKVLTLLNSENQKVFAGLPSHIQEQLVLDRDPHGNVQVSRISTETLLLEMVEKRLQSNSQFSGAFSGLGHFFGYEGRCAFPSNFDASYTYALGYTAVGLVLAKATGYIVSVGNLNQPVTQWTTGGIPITSLLNMETRHGKLKPVIKKALVELEQPVFQYFKAHREEWSQNDSFVFPGPIQYYGSSEICDLKTNTLLLELGIKL